LQSPYSTPHTNQTTNSVTHAKVIAGKIAGFSDLFLRSDSFETDNITTKWVVEHGSSVSNPSPVFILCLYLTEVDM
jgi:hypothetical protein